MKPYPLLFASLALTVAACGGGGSSASSGALPNNPGGTPVSSGSPPPAATPTPVGMTPPPKPTPTTKPTPTPVGATPTPPSTPTPPASYPPSHLRSTLGRIGLAQIFDEFGNTGTAMSNTQIASDGSRYDIVWGSFNPSPWRSATPSTLVSRYYIMEEDNLAVGGHSLQYWQQTHPDWIMYACDASGNPTHDIAYTPGDPSADVPLDIHNPAVIDYQVHNLGEFAATHAYNAVAIDEVIFRDVMLGGNAALGQTPVAGEFGCGVWNADGTFTKRWTSPSDPQWTTDIVNWIATAHTILHTDPVLAPYHLGIVINHPAGSIHDVNEQQLLSNVDATMDEAGFTDYGNYQEATASNLFAATLQYVKFVQSKGVAMVVINKYASVSSVSADQIEYSIATYLMGNEGSAYLFTVGSNGAGYGYGAENYHSEYATPLGAACGEDYGGPGYDARNPQIYYRRFANGLAVVNSGSLPVQTEYATLPGGHTYTDIDQRPVTNPLAVHSNDAYVMTTNGNGCQ